MLQHPLVLLPSMLMATLYIHLLSLLTKGEYEDLTGERLQQLQHSLADIKYLIIDEMSMVNRKMVDQIGKCVRQAFPHQADVMLEGLFKFALWRLWTTSARHGPSSPVHHNVKNSSV